MAAEVARQRPISPTEVEDTSGSFGAISPRHNSTADSIVDPQGFFDPNGPRQQHNSGGYSGPAGGPNTNPETYEHDSLSRVNSPPVIAGPSTESRLAVVASDRGNRSDTEGLIIRTPSERGSSVLPTTMPIPQPVDGTHREPWWNRPRLAWTKKGRWCFILTPLSICLIIALVVVVVLWQTSEGGGGRDVSVSLSTLTTVTIPQSSALPRANSGLGATTDDLATVFSSTNTSTSETILAYIDTASASPRLCIRKKSGTAWLSNVLCITDKDGNPKPDSPVTVLDWIGGPSVFFITADDKLGGIDWVPHSSSWKMSNLVAQKREVSKRSQLASVTWLNGTSAWLYYQDEDLQIREFGIDNYRDEVWRDGSVGPLSLAQDGSGIGVSRWMSEGGEVMEVFFQPKNSAIHGRVYRNSVWQSESYSVDGTPGTITGGASMTATTVNQKNETALLLAYVDSSGFLAVQSRGTEDISTIYSGFSTPKRLVEGDGKIASGLAAVGNSGEPRIYFVVNQKILELSALDVSAANWTTLDVTSV